MVDVITVGDVIGVDGVIGMTDVIRWMMSSGWVTLSLISANNSKTL